MPAGEKPFSHMASEQDWRNLVQYYRDCLIIEHRQQYVFDKGNFVPITNPIEEIDQFLQGTVSLEFDNNQRSQRNPVVRFIRNQLDNRARELCLGYPVFVLPDRRLAPLIYAPVQLTNNPNEIILQAQDPEISYAAFSSLGYDDKQIEVLLSEYDQELLNAGGFRIDTLLSFITSKLDDHIPQKLDWSDQFKPFTFFPNAGLFWVNPNGITRTLIQELETMAGPGYWRSVPEAVQKLLTSADSEPYPEYSPMEEDDLLYVTPVNREQSHAVQINQKTDITVVTGPPGTGKSQLILNIIANAFINNQTVLFASKNNRAVDVVINRLQGDMSFAGVVRTGNKTMRKAASAQMESALTAAGTEIDAAQIEGIREAYLQARLQAVEAIQVLKDVSDLSGLLKSNETERSETVSLLPKAVVTKLEKHSIEFSGIEIERLLTQITKFEEDALSLAEREREVTGETLKCVADEALLPITAALVEYEDQFGLFGAGFLRKKRFSGLPDLKAHLEAWGHLALALKMQIEVNRARGKESDSRAAYHDALSASDGLNEAEVKLLSSKVSSRDLAMATRALIKLQDEFFRIESNKISLLHRLAAALRIYEPLKKPRNILQKILEQLSRQTRDDDQPLTWNAQSCLEICKTHLIEVTAALNLIQLESAEKILASALGRYKNAIGKLPETIQKDARSLKPNTAVHQEALSDLEDLVRKIEKLQVEIDMIGKQINECLNSESHNFIKPFRQATKGDRLLWTLKAKLNINIIRKHLFKWQK
jgi:hypothetical protein